MRIVFSRFAVSSALVFASLASPCFAASARALNRNIGPVLESMPADGKALLRDISLGRESLDILEIEPMQVWASDAKITVYGAAGQETVIAPPDVKYFKGRVVGEDESVVFFSRSADGSIRGMVLIGARAWSLGSGVRKGAHPAADVRKDLEQGPADADAPLLISEIDENDDAFDPAAQLSCEVGKFSSNELPHLGLPGLSARAPKKVADAGNVAGATYQLRIAVETDNEFCGAAAFGNNTTALNTYIGDLIGKASIVYSRDVKTTLVLGDVHLRTGGPGTDPWNGTLSVAASLSEFGTYWHNNYGAGYPDTDGGGAGTAGAGASVARSSAVFLSGRTLGSGIAWVEVLCNDDFFCGTTGSGCNNGVASATYANQYAGGYAYNTSLSSVQNTVPDPEATVNGVQYGLPTTVNFWMLLEMMHELGHNVASPHSSCVALSPAEQVTYGVARGFVDQCLSGEGGCYSGTLTAPSEKGSIMSYCHNLFYSGSFRASRFLFGKAGEPSEKMLPIFNGGLEGCTANATVTVQTQPVSCSAGRTASVPACSGCTYAWQITGGTINTSSTIAAITYTPTQASVTLTVTVLTARGCGITASKAVVASCVPVIAPTNVVATATSTSNVQVTWTSSVGATSYNVYRSTDAITYGLAGNTASTLFNDAGRTANTAYLYKVRAVNGGESGDSNRDLATTVIFTDDPLVAATTVIQAVHITQLRAAVDAVRALVPLGGGSYTDPALTTGVTPMKVAHITDLRTALDAARSSLTLSAVSYGESITTSTTIKTTHLSELRNGVK
jgi:Metallo-peptidase family M12